MKFADVNTNTGSFSTTILDQMRSTNDIEYCSLRDSYTSDEIKYYDKSSNNIIIWDNLLLNKYYDKFVELGFNDQNIFNIGLMNKKEINEFISNLKMFPGHIIKMEKLYHYLKQIFFPSNIPSQINSNSKINDANINSNVNNNNNIFYTEKNHHSNNNYY